MNLFALGGPKVSFGAPPVLFWIAFGGALALLIGVIVNRDKLKPPRFWALIAVCVVGMLGTGGLGLLPYPQISYRGDVDSGE